MRRSPMTPIISTLSQPTSLGIIGDAAFAVTLTSQIWRINRVPWHA